MARPNQYLRLQPESTYFWQSVLLQIAVDFAFYGVHAAVFIAAIAASTRRDCPLTLVTLIIFTLFMSSTIAVTMDIMFYLLQTPVLLGYAGDWDTMLPMDIVLQICTRYNLLVSDAFVVWRAWALSRNSRIARGALLICILGSVVGVTIECVWWARDLTTENGVMTRTLMMDIPLLLTNAVATMLVGSQVWMYRRDIKVHIGPWKKRTRVERALILLLESGFAYCIIWIASLVIDLSMGTGKLNVYRAIGLSYHSISGIYPTLIVLVVALQRSATSSLLLSTQVSHAMVFADPAREQRLQPQTHGGVHPTAMVVAHENSVHPRTAEFKQIGELAAQPSTPDELNDDDITEIPARVNH